MTLAKGTLEFLILKIAWLFIAAFRLRAGGNGMPAFPCDDGNCGIKHHRKCNKTDGHEDLQLGLGSSAVRPRWRSAYLARTPHSSVMVRSASQRPLMSLQPGSHPQILASGQTWQRRLWQRQASAVPEHPIQVLLLRTNDLRFEAKRRQIERIIRADGIAAIVGAPGRRSFATAIDRQIFPLPNGRLRTTAGRIA